MGSVTPLKVDATTQLAAELASGDIVSPGALGNVATPVTSSGGTLYTTASQSNFFTLTITENITAFISGVPVGNNVFTFALLITQDATGGHTFTLPPVWKALGNSDTAIQTAPGAKTLIVFTTIGQSFYCYSMAKVAA